jgi:amidase
MNRRQFVSALGLSAVVVHAESPGRLGTQVEDRSRDLIFATASDLARLIRSRQVSASQVVRAHLDHLDVHNSKLNAIVTLDRLRAQRRAEEADEALARGIVWGPLHGVPMTLEDAHATKGLRSTWGGFPAVKDYVPAEDGAIASRVKAGGAVIIGKTNGPSLWPDSVFGRTNNPWNLEHTPGASSAGPGAAVAAGLTPLDIGLDTLGSIVNPSHCCGVYGMRPTEHRVPLTGSFFIDKTRKWRTMSVAGPMARSVDDLGLALRVLSGPDGFDSEVPAVPWKEIEAPEPKRLRIAWTSSFGGLPVAAEIKDAVARFAQELARAGANVTERLPDVDFRALGAFANRLFEIIAGSDAIGGATLLDYFKALEERDRYISVWDRFLTECDVFMCPAGLMTAERHGVEQVVIDGAVITKDDIAVLDVPYSISPVSGCPVVVMPLGTDRHGLPLGVQMMARRWQDERLLANVRFASGLTDGFRKPPGY